jgi:hypothetical protein
MRNHRFATVVVALVAVAANSAPAAELPAELEDLIKEGSHWFDVAGNTDLSTTERNEARKKAWVNLYKAHDILGKHWEAHPGDQNRIEDRMMDVGKKVFWIKKESPIGLLESTGVGPKPAPPINRPDWGDKPADDAPPSRPPDPVPGRAPPPSPTPGSAPPSTAPPAPTGPSADVVFKEAEEYARKHRADTAGILERFQDFMVRFPDASSPLFLKAAQAAGTAQSSLKDAYRLLRDEDPDSLKDVDRMEIRRTLLILVQDLASRDAAVRERAARLVGLVGSGDGLYPLVKALASETEAQCIQVMSDAAVSIGGRKAAEQFGGLRKTPKTASLGLALLVRLAAKNPVDRRIAVKEMGPFALLSDEEVALRAVDTLVGMGKEGAYGLVEALGTKNVDVRCRIIEALGATGHPKVASPLSKFLIGGDNPNTVRCRDVAEKAIKSLGEPCVPYLWHGLRDGATKMHTGKVLRDITGHSEISKIGPWQDWWKKKYPDWKEEKD